PPPSWIRRKPATAGFRLPGLSRVVEAGGERAVAAELPVERVVVHHELVCDELGAPDFLARADARDSAAGRAPPPRPAGHGRADRDAALADLDPARAHLEQVAGLPHPREPQHALAAGATEQDVGERRALPLVAALVDMEHEAPRRAGLVVVVLVDERCRETG